jgi:hypothetical protein
VDAAGTLETMSEIGISIAGFSGIVGALAGERLRPSHPDVWIPFSVMISSSLGLVFSALFPFLPYHIGVPENVVWAASSALVSVVAACNMAFFLPRIWRGQRDGTVPKTLVFDVSVQVSSVLVLVSQVLNTLGIGLSRNAGGFLIGLYLILLIAGLNFAFFLYVLARSGRHPPAV